MKRFKRILVFAGTETPESAINRAAQLALENKASLTLMDVVKPLPRALGMMTDIAKPAELEHLVVQDRRRRLLDIASEMSDTGVRLDVVVVVGDPATEVTRQVILEDHDLVVKNADGLSATGRLFGSVAKSLLRLCPCPVWLLKPQIHGEFDRVLCAIDVESEDKQHADMNRKIMELAFSIAQRDNAQLHVASAWQIWMEDSMRHEVGDNVIATIRADHEAKVHQVIDELLQAPYAHAVDVKLHLKHGAPAEVIRSVADEIEADLMVMGTVCRTGIAGFLIGNTAESIVAELTCSLLALKPDGFVSPIKMSHVVLTEEDEELPLM